MAEDFLRHENKLQMFILWGKRTNLAGIVTALHHYGCIKLLARGDGIEVRPGKLQSLGV